MSRARGAGVLLAVLLAFVAGWMLGRGSEPRRGPVAAAPAADRAGLRNPYSPRVLDDPAFLAQQRENAEALERQCRATGEFCDEARALRREPAEPRVSDSLAKAAD